jgi:HK97 family phage major capsid protein
MPSIIESKEYRALIQERADLTAEAKAVLESGSLTAEQKERDDVIDARITDINGDISRFDRQRERERNTPPNPEPEPVPANSTHPIHTKPNTPSGGPYASMGHQLQDIYTAATNGKGSLEAAERLASVASFHQQEFGAIAQGAGAAIDSDGGFLIQTTFSSEILRKMHELGTLISAVRRIPLDADSNSLEINMIDEQSRATGSRWGGIRGYWVDEGTAPTASKPTFAKLQMKTRKVAALAYVTDELLRNASAMSSILIDGFAEELLFLTEDAIFEGDGSGKPQGFTNSPALVTISKESGQSADTVVTENLKKMWARGYGRGRRNMTWYINQDVEPALDDLIKVIGAAGIEPNWVSYSPEGILRIKGRPVVTIEYSSTLGDLNDIVLADLSQYALIDQGGIQQAQSIHVAFTTFETAFRAHYSVDGGSMWKEALTPFKGGANTTSPFISLAARD